jgi:hypothetical protein
MACVLVVLLLFAAIYDHRARKRGWSLRPPSEMENEERENEIFSRNADPPRVQDL